MNNLKLVLLSFCLGVAFNSFAQVNAIKMKHYYWNNPNHHFSEVLTKKGKVLYDSVISQTGLDTSLCFKVKYDSIINSTNRKYLKVHGYLYLEYSVFNGQMRKNYYQSYNGYDSCQKQQCILSFATNKDNIDVVTLYLIK
jgi:hypothetical protein